MVITVHFLFAWRGTVPEPTELLTVAVELERARSALLL